MKRWSLVLLLAACAPDPKAAPTDDFSAWAVEKADAFSKHLTLVGGLAYGQTSAPVAYRNPPRYDAFSFTGAAGDAVDAWVRSADGDAVAWLTDASWNTLARNDDASASTTDAHLSLALPAAGTYYVIFREYRQAPAHFTVALTGPTGAGATGPTTSGGGTTGATPCPSGHARCSGSTLQSCVNGAWQDQQDCSASGQACRSFAPVAVCGNDSTVATPAPPFAYAPSQTIDWTLGTSGLQMQLRHDYAYDASGHLASDTQYQIQNGSWAETQRFDYTDDANGRVHSFTVSEQTANGGFGPAEQWTCFFDAQGRETMSQHQLYQNGVLAAPVDEFIYDYSHREGPTDLVTETFQSLTADGWTQNYVEDVLLSTTNVLSEITTIQPSGRFSEIDSYFDSGGKLELQYYRFASVDTGNAYLHYVYDSAGRIDHIDEYESTHQTLTAQQRFSYQNGRLVLRERSLRDAASGQFSIQTRTQITHTDQGSSTGFVGNAPLPTRPWARDLYGSGAYFAP